MEPTNFQKVVLTVPEEFSLHLCGGRGSGRTTACLLLAVRAMSSMKKVAFVGATYEQLTMVQEQLDIILPRSCWNSVFWVFNSKQNPVPHDLTIVFADDGRLGTDDTGMALAAPWARMSPRTVIEGGQGPTIRQYLPFLWSARLFERMGSSSLDNPHITRDYLYLLQRAAGNDNELLRFWLTGDCRPSTLPLVPEKK